MNECLSLRLVSLEMHPRTWLRATTRLRDLAVIVLITAICFFPALSHQLGWLKNNHGEIHSKIQEEVADPISANMRGNKRNLWNFHNMISCGTHRNSFHYVGYGCWCGLGGTGKPRDAVDRCCYAHDVCYNNLICSKKCGWPYKVMIYLRTYTTKSCTTCSPASSYSWWVWYKQCREELCKCDSEAVRCLARNEHEYNKLHRNTNKKQHCKQHETPSEYRAHC